jgi:hypothetical protein
MTNEIWQRTLSRRAMLRAAGLGGLAAVAAACTGGGPKPPPGSPSVSPAAGSIAQLVADADEELSLLTGLGDNPEDAIQTGTSVYIMDLSSGPTSLLQGGTPQLFVALDVNAKARGPYPATWSLFTGYEKTGDTSPKSPIPGIYWGEIDIPTQGLWTIAAVAKDGSKTGVGIGHAIVRDQVTAAVGSKAVSVPTPVATTPAAIAKICTRVPVDEMHYISLDHALTNGKPTVVSFATPKFCTSRLCGPVVDEQILVFEKVGKDRANFIHVEEFPTQDVAVQSPPFVAWGLQTEPWIFVIDAKGIIRARFLGPATADMIESALTPLLG